MTTRILGLWLALLLLVPQVHGQTARHKVRINSVRVGFPAGPHSDPSNTGGNSICKAGPWVPVVIDLQGMAEQLPPLEVVVETADSDDVNQRYTVIVPALQFEQTEKVISYIRLGGQNPELTVSVRANGRNLCPPEQVRPDIVQAPSSVIYLAIGSRLPGLIRPGVEADENPDNPSNQNLNIETTAVVRVKELPRQWFVYNGVDLVLLTTSDRDFITELASDTTGRRAAIAEWVRRGGRLVVSVGRNQDLVAGLDELKAVLPMTPVGTHELDVPMLRWPRGTGGGQDAPGPMTLAKLEPKPGRKPVTIVTGPRPVETEPPVPIVTQAAYGLGRVTLVAFDIDQKPLTTWKGRAGFWKELLESAGPKVPTANNQGRVFMPGYGSDPNDSAFESIIKHQEDFPGVPVISFGWVALFILLYIILVGPVDYLFLKYVVKRLELTWVTFPTIVLLVSAGAYYAAYALKGSDLRINKMDLIEIDLHGKQIHGRSWFTLFSPRIQNYTVGIEPSAEWVGGVGTNFHPVVSWSGQTRMGRQSLFRRSYNYLQEARGLIGVPIQVWSTKGFQANWELPIDNARPPFAADLRHPPGQKSVIGSVTNLLPIDLENVYMIHWGSGSEPTVRSLGELQSGVPKQVTSVESQPLSNLTNFPGVVPISVLFHERFAATQGQLSNASLRDIDQSWRVAHENPDEVMIIGTAKAVSGRAEDVTAGPSMPAKLWLGALPDTDPQRPKLDGTLRQETTVRVFIPVN